jgi:hypothetical protein
VLVFMPVRGGYRYLGHFGAGAIMPCSDGLSVLVYEPCGGHYGYIKAYRHDGKRFVCYLTEDIVVGDGAPEENNWKLEELFPKEKVIKWEKTPDPDAVNPAIALRLHSVNHWRGVSDPFPSA